MEGGKEGKGVMREEERKREVEKRERESGKGRREGRREREGEGGRKREMEHTVNKFYLHVAPQHINSLCLQY